MNQARGPRPRLPCPTWALLAWALAVRFALGCGGGLKYTVDDAALEAVPAGDRTNVLEARRELDRAHQEQRTVASDLDSVGLATEVADQEKEGARLEIERAIAAQEGARASQDENQANAAAHNRDVADLGLKASQAKLTWLGRKKDWLKQSGAAAEAHIEAAKARVELEKAQVAQQKGLKPGGDFQVSDYESQWQHKNADWEAEKRDMAADERDTKKKEDEWRQLETQYRTLKR